MAERVFADKLERAGFADIWVGGHRPFGIDQAALYPLFTPEVTQVMRRTIPADHQTARSAIGGRRSAWRRSGSVRLDRGDQLAAEGRDVLHHAAPHQVAIL